MLWLGAAILSAFFAGVTSILAKCGIRETDSELATALRTVVVLVFAWGMVLVVGSAPSAVHIDKKALAFLLLSGLATGASWLCYYYAIQNGRLSVVVPIDKLSILVTVLFSYAVFRERLSKKALAGLCLMVSGTLLLALC